MYMSGKERWRWMLWRLCVDDIFVFMVVMNSMLSSFMSSFLISFSFIPTECAMFESFVRECVESPKKSKLKWEVKGWLISVVEMIYLLGSLEQVESVTHFRLRMDLINEIN